MALGCYRGIHIIMAPAATPPSDPNLSTGGGSEHQHPYEHWLQYGLRSSSETLVRGTLAAVQDWMSPLP